MTKQKQSVGIPDELLISRILLVRDKKVMLDKDLAELYGVTTTRLNEQVKRNVKRFPRDFMFQLSDRQKRDLIDHYPHLENLKFSPHNPYVFTEHGAVMLASVLNSKRAIEANIQIVRIFTQMREILHANRDILSKIEQLEQKVFQTSEEVQLLFLTIKKLLDTEGEKPPRGKIGFRRTGEKD